MVNPYSVARCGSAQAAVEAYARYIVTRPDLMAALSELRGKRLGCWCKPKPCHGDVLSALADRCASTTQ